MTTRASLSRSEARWAIKQSGVAEMHGVVAYAEAFAIIAAGLGVTMGDPARLVRRLIEDTLRGELHWRPEAHTFPVHLRKATRLAIASHLALQARTRGHAPALWEARLAVVQIGDLRGVEQLAHWAGEMMTSVRANDSEMLAQAIKLTDFVRERLAAFAGDPDEEDTAPNVEPAIVAVVLGEAEDKKTN